jgi:hypothetical protein
VTVALDDLVGRGRRHEAEGGAHVGLDRGVEVREGADRPADLADRDVAERQVEAIAAAAQLVPEDRELPPEGGRLGVDAVAAADADGVLVFERAALQGGQQSADAASNQPAAEALPVPAQTGTVAAPVAAEKEEQKTAEEKKAVENERASRAEASGEDDKGKATIYEGIRAWRQANPEKVRAQGKQALRIDSAKPRSSGVGVGLNLT